jgi:hypothetical protein
MPRLSEANRKLLGGASVVDVNCSRNTVHELVRRYGLTGDVHDRQMPASPRATTQRYDREIVLTHRFRPATLTAPTFNVTAQTIRNRLRAQQRPIRARCPHTGGIPT